MKRGKREEGKGEEGTFCRYPGRNRYSIAAGIEHIGSIVLGLYSLCDPVTHAGSLELRACAPGGARGGVSPPTKAREAQPAAEVETDGTARLLQTRHTDGLRVSTQPLYSLRSGVRE